MFEKIVSLILNKFLSKYIRNLEKENLKVGILESDIKLHNLEIKSDALYNFGIPITIKAGHIGTIVCDLKWNKSQSLVIHVEDIFIQAEPLTQGTFDLAKEQNFLRALKRKVLAQAGSRFAPIGDSSDNEKEEQLAFETNNYFDRFMIKLLKKVKINIKNVHIKYEDGVCKSGSIVTIGIIMESFSLEDSTAIWYTGTESKEAKEYTKYKAGKVRSVFLYWNVRSIRESRRSIFREIGQVLSWRNWMKEFMDGALSDVTNSEARSNEDRWNRTDYVMKDFNLRILLSLSKRDSVPFQSDPDVSILLREERHQRLDRPKIGLEVELDPLHLFVSRQQYASMFDLLSSYSRMMVNLPFHKYYPINGEIKGPVMAWKCLNKIIIEQCVRPYQWKHILHYRKKYRKYKNILFRMYTIGLSTWENMDLQELEDQLNLTSIVVAREEAKIEFMAKCPSSEKIKDIRLIKSWWYQYPLNYILPPNVVRAVTNSKNADDYYENSLVSNGNVTHETNSKFYSPTNRRDIKDVLGSNIRYAEENCSSLFGNLNKEDLADIYKFILGGGGSGRSFRNSSTKRKNYTTSSFRNKKVVEYPPLPFINKTLHPIDHQFIVKIPLVEIKLISLFADHVTNINVSLYQIDLIVKHRWENQGLDIQLTQNFLRITAQKYGKEEISTLADSRNNDCDSDPKEFIKLRLETFPIYDNRLQFSVYLGLQPLNLTVTHNFLADIINFTEVPGTVLENVIQRLLKPMLDTSRLCYTSLLESFRSRPLLFIKGDIYLPIILIECKESFNVPNDTSLEQPMSIRIELGTINLTTDLPKLKSADDRLPKGINLFVQTDVRSINTANESLNGSEENLYQKLNFIYYGLKMGYLMNGKDPKDIYNITPLPLIVTGLFNHVINYERRQPMLNIKISIEPFEINLTTHLLDYLTSYMDLRKDLSGIASICLNIWKPRDRTTQVQLMHRNNIIGMESTSWDLTNERCSCHYEFSIKRLFHKKSTTNLYNLYRFDRMKKVTDSRIEDMFKNQRILLDELNDISYTYAIDVAIVKVKFRIYCHKSYIMKMDNTNNNNIDPNDFLNLAYTLDVAKAGTLGKFVIVKGEIKKYLHLYVGNMAIDDYLSNDATSLQLKVPEEGTSPSAQTQPPSDGTVKLYIPILSTVTEYRFLSILVIHTTPNIGNDGTKPGHLPTIYSKDGRRELRNKTTLIPSWDNTIMVTLNPLHMRLDEASLKNVHALLTRSGIYNIVGPPSDVYEPTEGSTARDKRSSITSDSEERKWERRKKFLRAIALEKLCDVCLDTFAQFALALRCDDIKVNFLCHEVDGPEGSRTTTGTAHHLLENYCYALDIRGVTFYTHFSRIFEQFHYNKTAGLRRNKSCINLYDNKAKDIPHFNQSYRTDIPSHVINRVTPSHAVTFRFNFRVESFDFCLRLIWNTKVMLRSYYETAPKVTIFTTHDTKVPLFDSSYELVLDKNQNFNRNTKSLSMKFGNFRFALGPMIFEPFIHFCTNNYLILLILFVLGVFGKVVKLIFNTVLFDSVIPTRLHFSLEKSVLQYFENLPFEFLEDPKDKEVHKLGAISNIGLRLSWESIKFENLECKVNDNNLTLRQGIHGEYHHRLIKIVSLTLCLADDRHNGHENSVVVFEPLSFETCFRYETMFDFLDVPKITCSLNARVPFKGLRICVSENTLFVVGGLVSYLCNLMNFYTIQTSDLANFYEDIALANIRNAIDSKPGIRQTFTSSFPSIDIRNCLKLRLELIEFECSFMLTKPTTVNGIGSLRSDRKLSRVFRSLPQNVIPLFKLNLSHCNVIMDYCEPLNVVTHDSDPIPCPYPILSLTVNIYQMSFFVKQPPVPILKLYGLVSIHPEREFFNVVTLTPSGDVISPLCKGLLTYHSGRVWKMDVNCHPGVVIHFNPTILALTLLYLSVIEREFALYHYPSRYSPFEATFADLRNLVMQPRSITITIKLFYNTLYVYFRNDSQKLTLNFDTNFDFTFNNNIPSLVSILKIGNLSCLHDSKDDTNAYLSRIIFHPFNSELSYTIEPGKRELFPPLNLNIPVLCGHVSPNLVRAIISGLEEYYDVIFKPHNHDYYKILHIPHPDNVVTVAPIPPNSIDAIDKLYSENAPFRLKTIRKLLNGTLVNGLRFLVEPLLPTRGVLLSLSVRDVSIFVDDNSSFALPILSLKSSLLTSLFVTKDSLYSVFRIDLESYMLDMKQGVWQSFIEPMGEIGHDGSVRPWNFYGSIFVSMNDKLVDSRQGNTNFYDSTFSSLTCDRNIKLLKNHFNLPNNGDKVTNGTKYICETLPQIMGEAIPMQNIFILFYSEYPLDVNVTPDSIQIITQIFNDLYSHQTLSDKMILNNRLGTDIEGIKPLKTLEQKVHDDALYATVIMEAPRFRDANDNPCKGKDKSIQPINCAFQKCSIYQNSTFPGPISGENFYPARRLSIKLKDFEGDLVVDLFKINILLSHHLKYLSKTFPLYSHLKISHSNCTITLFSGYRLYNYSKLSFKILVMPIDKSCPYSYFILLPDKYYDIPITIFIKFDRLFIKPITDLFTYAYTRIDKLILANRPKCKYVRLKVLGGGGGGTEVPSRTGSDLFLKAVYDSGGERCIVRRRRDSDSDEIFRSSSTKSLLLQAPLTLRNHLPFPCTVDISNDEPESFINTYKIEPGSVRSVYHVDPSTAKVKSEYKWKFRLPRYRSLAWESGDYAIDFGLKKLPTLLELSPTTHPSQTVHLYSKVVENITSGTSVHLYVPCYVRSHCAGSCKLALLPHRRSNDRSKSDSMVTTFDKFYVIESYDLAAEKFILGAYTKFDRPVSDTPYYYESASPFTILSQSNKFRVGCRLVEPDSTGPGQEVPRDLNLYMFVERCLTYPSYNIINIYPAYRIKNSTDYRVGFFSSRPRDGETIGQGIELSNLVTSQPHSEMPYWPLIDDDLNLLIISEVANHRLSVSERLVIPPHHPLTTTFNYPTPSETYRFTLDITNSTSGCVTLHIKRYRSHDTPLVVYNFCKNHSISIKQKGLPKDRQSLVLGTQHLGFYAWPDLMSDKTLFWEIGDNSQVVKDYHEITTIPTNKEKSFGSCLIMENNASADGNSSAAEPIFATFSLSSSGGDPDKNLLPMKFGENEGDQLTTPSKKISHYTYLSPSIYSKLLLDAQMTSSISDHSTETMLKSDFNEKPPITIYWASFFNHNLQRTIIFSEDRKMAEYFGMPPLQQQRQFSTLTFFYVHQDRLGLSLIGQASQELAYISISNSPSKYMLLSMDLIGDHKRSTDENNSLELRYQYKNGSHLYRAIIQRLQIDNQVINAIYPCVLYPSPLSRTIIYLPGTDPMIRFNLEFQLQKGSFHLNSLKIVKIDLLPFDVNIDRGFLLSLWSYYSDLKKNYTKLMVVSDSIEKYLREERIYIDHLSISDIRSNICFTIRGDFTSDDDPSSREFLNFCLDFFGSSVADVSNVDIRLSPYEKKGICQNFWEIISDVVSHYFYRGLWQSYVFILGLDIIGNPYNFVRDISQGFKNLMIHNTDILHETTPAIKDGHDTQAIIQFRKDPIKASFLFRLLAFIFQSIGILLGPFLAISENMSETMSLLTFDRMFQRERKRLLNCPSATIRQFIAKLIRCLTLGLVSGVADIIYMPIAIYNGSLCDEHTNVKDMTLRQVDKSHEYDQSDDMQVYEDTLDYWSNDHLPDMENYVSVNDEEMHRKSLSINKEMDEYMNAGVKTSESTLNHSHQSKALSTKILSTLLVGALLKPIVSLLDGVSCILDIGRRLTGVGEPIMERVRPPRASNPIIGLPHYSLAQALCFKAYAESYTRKKSSPKGPDAQVDIRANHDALDGLLNRTNGHEEIRFHNQSQNPCLATSSHEPEHFIFASPACDIKSGDDDRVGVPTEVPDLFPDDDLINCENVLQTMKRFERSETLIVLTNKRVSYLTKNFLWGYWQLTWYDELSNLTNVRKNSTTLELSYVTENKIGVDYLLSGRKLGFVDASSMEKIFSTLNLLLSQNSTQDSSDL